MKEKDITFLKNAVTNKQWKDGIAGNGEGKPILDFKASNWYVSKVDGKIHDLTYNPTDKVEPKFNAGQWSEEDEDYYDAIIAKLEVTQDYAGLTDNQMEFLKSIKQRIGG